MRRVTVMIHDSLTVFLNIHKVSGVIQLNLNAPCLCLNGVNSTVVPLFSLLKNDADWDELVKPPPRKV